MDTSIKIIVADFHPYMLKGIAVELEGERKFHVVAKLHDLDELEARLSKTRIDILIIDYWFKEENTLLIIKKLCSKIKNLKVIIYSQEERTSYVKEALNVVNGYILKSEPEGALKNAILRVLANKKAISEDIRESCELMNNNSYSLSSQEYKIINFRVDGMNPNIISNQLSISEKTVRKHIDNARKKLGFGTTEDMIRWFWQQK